MAVPMTDNPKRLTRAFFKRHGKQGGLASGERKSRGDREYYAELGRKAAAARKAKKSAKLDDPHSVITE